MAMTPAERQRLYRQRRAANEPNPHLPNPQQPKTAGRGSSAGPMPSNTLRTLQQEYETWREQLPASLADSRTAELLDGVCDLDLDDLDVELPRGFGRD